MYRNVCGKVQPIPSNSNLFDQNFDLTNSTFQNEQNGTDTSSLIDFFETKKPLQDYPSIGTFVYVGVFFGVRLETLLLDQQYNNRYLRHIVGLKNGNQARIIDAQATCLKTYKFKDAARLGLLQGLTFDIVPVDLRKTVPPFGTRYHTGTSFDTSLNHEALRNDLISFQFGFGTNENIKYYIDRNTIKVRRSRSR